MHISHLLFSYRLGVSGPAQSYFVRQFRGGLLAQLSICCTKAFSEIKLLFVTPYGATERQSVARIMWPKPSSRARAIARRTAKASASSGAVTSLSKMLAARSQAGSSVVPDHDTDSHASSRNKQLQREAECKDSHLWEGSGEERARTGALFNNSFNSVVYRSKAIAKGLTSNVSWIFVCTSFR